MVYAYLQAHCHYIALKSFRDSLSESNLSPVNMAMMDCLGALFATHGIISRAGEFMTVCMFVCVHVIQHLPILCQFLGWLHDASSNCSS